MAYQYKGKIRDVTPLTTVECGTNSGYARHYQLKTPVCQPCRDAHLAAGKAWRERRRNPTKMRNQCATYPGYMRHKRAGEDACDLCLDAYAQYMRDYRERKAAA